MSEQATETDNRTAEDKSDERRLVWLHSAAWGLLALVLYVLSVGPAAAFGQWAQGRSGMLGWTGDALELLYFPLIWLADEFPAIRNALGGYVDFWEAAFDSLF